MQLRLVKYLEQSTITAKRISIRCGIGSPRSSLSLYYELYLQSLKGSIAENKWKTQNKIPYVTDMQACPDICSHLPAKKPTVHESAANEHHSQYNTSKPSQLI